MTVRNGQNSSERAPAGSNGPEWDVTVHNGPERARVTGQIERYWQQQGAVERA